MPVDAQPVPWPEPSSPTGRLTLHRTYRDALDRPMFGKVTIAGNERSENGSSVVVPAPVVVQLTDGVLEVTLPPGTYRLEAELRTTDGARTSDVATVALD